MSELCFVFASTAEKNADKIIIVFSDENDQSFLSPTLEPSDLSTAIAAAPDTKLYVFTLPYYRGQWRRYINPTGGSAFILTSNSEQMYDDLMSILDDICLSADDQARNQPHQHSFMMNVSRRVKHDYVLLMCY